MIDDFDYFMEENSKLFNGCTFCVLPIGICDDGKREINLHYDYDDDGFITITSRISVDVDVSEKDLKEEIKKARKRIADFLGR